MVVPYVVGIVAVAGAVKAAEKVSKRRSAASQKTASSNSTDTKKEFITAVRDRGVVIGDKRYFSTGEGSQTSYKVTDRNTDEVEDILKKEVIRAYERATEEGIEMAVGDFTDTLEEPNKIGNRTASTYSAGVSDSSITSDQSNSGRTTRDDVEASYEAHEEAQNRSPPVELGCVYKILLEEESKHHSGRRDMRGTYQGFQIFVKDVPENVGVDEVVNVKITSFSRENTAAHAKITDN